MKRNAVKSYVIKFQRAIGWYKLSIGVRRVIVGIIGGLVLIVGAAMIVLPGPAFVMLPLGLAILSTEFVWARRWLKKALEYSRKLKRRNRGKPSVATRPG